ncbi:MAG: hypothetical protein KGR18_03525 [Acidobacteria bacterium]|nr:hypothetical protein [Acidobacteriota bacterium]
MSRSRRRPANTTKKAAADRAASRRFWSGEAVDDPALVHMTDDPSAMVVSLGDPPLRGRERAAQATFVLVYRRAAQLALLAATAAGLDDDSQPT